MHVRVCAHMYVSMFGWCCLFACRGQRFCIIRATDTETPRASACMCVSVCERGGGGREREREKSTFREHIATSNWPHAKNALGREGYTVAGENVIWQNVRRSQN